MGEFVLMGVEEGVVFILPVLKSSDAVAFNDTEDKPVEVALSEEFPEAVAATEEVIDNVPTAVSVDAEEAVGAAAVGDTEGSPLADPLQERVTARGGDWVLPPLALRLEDTVVQAVPVVVPRGVPVRGEEGEAEVEGVALGEAVELKVAPEDAEGQDVEDPESVGLLDDVPLPVVTPEVVPDSVGLGSMDGAEDRDTVTSGLGLLLEETLARPDTVEAPELEEVLDGKGVAVKDTTALPLGVGRLVGVGEVDGEGEGVLIAEALLMEDWEAV